MRAARERILADVRSSLNRDRIGADLEAELRARIAAHRRNPTPARAAMLDHRAQVDLFVTMAEEVQATVARVSSIAVVPEAVAHYLAAENLPAQLVMAPDPSLDAIPWTDCCRFDAAAPRQTTRSALQAATPRSPRPGRLC